jgi:hypothetical protein
MRGRWVAVGLVVVLIFGTAVALAQEGNTNQPAEESVDENAGLPPFLTGDQEMPPGLAKRDTLPPGLAKKLGDNTPPGQAKKDGDFVPPGLAQKGEDWLPPGLAKQGKIPPGHAKRLGVDPTTGTDTDTDTDTADE